jgi:hypothetical protein
MAKDHIHFSVKSDLEKEGWFVTSDPFTILLSEDETYFDVDLAAEKAENDFVKKIIAIEIKSFAGPSMIHAFHEALGQYLNYRAAIEEQNLERDLFLAVSIEGWNRLNKLKFVQRRIKQFQLQFVLINIHDKSVAKWIK